MSKPLRAAMPNAAAIIDDLREHFGAEEIHGQIRKGMTGLPVFYAREAGQEIGTRAPEVHGVDGTQMVLESIPLQSLKKGRP